MQKTYVINDEPVSLAAWLTFKRMVFGTKTVDSENETEDAYHATFTDGSSYDRDDEWESFYDNKTD